MLPDCILTFPPSQVQSGFFFRRTLSSPICSAIRDRLSAIYSNCSATSLHFFVLSAGGIRSQISAESVFVDRHVWSNFLSCMFRLFEGDVLRTVSVEKFEHCFE